MRSFDEKVWKDRALTRLKKRQSASRANAEKRYANELKAISNLHTVIEWCESRSLTVNFTNVYSGYYEPTEKLIQINVNMLPERQLYTLLHETGHHLIQTCGSARVRSSKNYDSLDPDDPHTLHQKVDVVEEEYEAWDRGRKLAKRLKLSIDYDGFDKLKVTNIRTYFVWALHKAKA